MQLLLKQCGIKSGSGRITPRSSSVPPVRLIIGSLDNTFVLRISYVSVEDRKKKKMLSLKFEFGKLLAKRIDIDHNVLMKIIAILKVTLF